MLIINLVNECAKTAEEAINNKSEDLKSISLKVHYVHLFYHNIILFYLVIRFKKKLYICIYIYLIRFTKNRN